MVALCGTSGGVFSIRRTAREPCSAISTKTLSRIARCFVDGTTVVTISNKLPSKTEFVDDFGDIDPEVKTIAYSRAYFHHPFKQKELPPTWPSARASYRRGHALLTAASRLADLLVGCSVRAGGCARLHSLIRSV